MYKFLVSLIVCSTIILCNHSYSQQKLIKLFEKKEFDKAEKKVNKELESIRKGKVDIEDPRVKYVKALLYNEKKFSMFVPDSAYTYLIYSIGVHRKVKDVKLTEDLKENLFNQDLINKTMLAICENAYEIVHKQNTEDAYNGYLSYYKDGNEQVRGKVIQDRNEVSYQTALNNNTVESFQDFINKYPKAEEVPSARENRDALAYEISSNEHTIQSYKSFIKKYPNAIQVSVAWGHIYDIDFENAKSANKASAYYDHMNAYAKSSHYDEALTLSHDCEFNETIIENQIESYLEFVNRFGAKNPNKPIALDTLFNHYEQELNFDGMEFCVNKANNKQRKKLVLRYHDIYTIDGEWSTLNKFYNKYDDLSLSGVKKEDYRIAEMGRRIILKNGYSESQFNQYDTYIKEAAPTDRAYVALIRMIKKDIDGKLYSNALGKAQKYSEEFKVNKNYQSLINLLKTPIDKSIRIKEITTINNEENGRQYCPEISADEKTMYFCGNGREDNLGGEDIFYSTKTGKNLWSKPKLLGSLNTMFGNEALEHISADNTSVYLFSGGDIKQSEITQSGYTTPNKLNSNINQGSWQADISVSSDGNALLFSSIYSENFNYNNKSSNGMIGDLNDYHGSAGHQSDIYISLKDKNGKWGKAMNLGPAINTIHCDRSAFLHPDMKTLYFSSDGHGGFGSLDVFVSKRLADSCWNCWSEPMNLGKEINSTSSDWGYNINTNGDKAYFSRKSKIAYINLPKHLRPNFVATVNGTVTNDKDEIVPCSIKWEDLETGKEIGTSKSNPKDGNYYMVLPLGKNYGYYIEKEGYFPLSNNVNVKKANKPISITEDIQLISFKQMIEEGVPVRLNNLFFNSGKSNLLPSSIPELKRVAKIIQKENLKVEISGHTDNVGDTKMNQKLSEDRANSVREFLISEGVSENLLTTIGFGESKPVESNNTTRGKAKNRRVELRFLNI
jgi:outer membrane protein OmpA-like peptidoglycan-associated protein